MSTTIAGVEVPETAATAAATAFALEHTSQLIYDHSRRVFLFGSLRAAQLGLRPDPELLYVASLMHDTGLFTPYSREIQRFEVDGADHARALLLQNGFDTTAADVVWKAIALHTSPGIPSRMGPEIAATTYGVLLDALGIGLDDLDAAVVDEVVATHPRGDFKKGFLQAFVDGLADRPDTAYGTINADVLARFVPGYQRGSMVDRVLGSAWVA
ncbi:MAG TPA: HD domain-containing protein [Marmoricola sp.]|jgi:hypothetical protein|nr:HD domain-containing protein [Marmoricola sp.]